ncbi:MAG: phosphatase PAP2 family protein [Clostridia bacterium]|nr:phosphatase PAP2 family protein [Clostridia bacterium]
MKKKARVSLICSLVFLALFLLLTFLVMKVDVQPIGPNGSTVGLGSINEVCFRIFGSNPIWDKISDLCMAGSLLVAGGFACLGVWQLISRKSLKKVDLDLYLLAGLYAVTVAFYLLFEVVVINCRPVLVDGILEPSYPSSHTMLVFVILISAIVQVGLRVKNRLLRYGLTVAATLVGILTAVSRLFAGVHWFTDVFAAILLSGFLTFLYKALVLQFKRK